MLKLLLALLLSAAAARADVVQQGRDVVFGGEEGGEGKRLCPATLTPDEFLKARKPEVRGGTAWNLTARITSGNKWIIPDSKDALIIVEEFADFQASAGASGKTGARRIGRQTAKGFRIKYFGEDGEALWTRTAMEKGDVAEVSASYDASLILILLKPENKSGGKDPFSYRLIVYDRSGRRHMSFHPGSGLCPFRSLSDVWTSRSGRYLILSCGFPKNTEAPFFFQPKSRLFWRPGKHYRLVTAKEEEYSGSAIEEDEIVRVTLKEAVLRDPDAEEEPGEPLDLSLAEADWLPLKNLR